MDDTITDTKSRLDELTAAPLRSDQSVVVPAASYLPPAERHGALKVEVARSAAATRATISEMAMLLGERGFYRWPVKNRKKGTTDWVEGVSIKGAMALVKAYKNCRVACPVIVDLGSHWRFHAVFIDFENGIEIERSFIQRKSGGTMGDDAARREDMAFQIGLSKAERNVVVNALELEADVLLEECRGAIVDRVGRDIEHYRRTIVERANERGIDLARIEAVAGRPVKDWLGTDMVRIIGMMAAIRDGMATAEETFPKLGANLGDDVKDTRRDESVANRLDSFATTDQPDTAGLSGGQAAASPQAPPPVGAAAAQQADPVKLQHDMVYRLLRLAQDQKLTVAERLENLEGLDIGLHDMLPRHPEFVDTALNTAAKVAKDELEADAAMRYLTGLVSP